MKNRATRRKLWDVSTLGISITQVAAKLVFFRFLLLPVLSAESFVLFSRLSLRCRSWRWRLLINFSQWLALFVRRYGIFSLRFSNRSSILDPSDPSIPFFLLRSPTNPLLLPPPRVSPCIVCVGSRLGGTNGGNTRENVKDEEKDEVRLFLFQERSFEYEYALIDS